VPESDAPEMDARGVVIISAEQRAKLDRLGIVATEPAGSVRPCMYAAHKVSWHRRPWPMGDMACDICHPSAETLRAEGFPHGNRNLAPPKTTGRYIAPPAPKWERASSDLAGQTDAKTSLFGSDF
jgi:hypothetical protein